MRILPIILGLGAGGLIIFGIRRAASAAPEFGEFDARERLCEMDPWHEDCEGTKARLRAQIEQGITDLQARAAAGPQATIVPPAGADFAKRGAGTTNVQFPGDRKVAWIAWQAIERGLMTAKECRLRLQRLLRDGALPGAQLPDVGPERRRELSGVITTLSDWTVEQLGKDWAALWIELARRRQSALTNVPTWQALTLTKNPLSHEQAVNQVKSWAQSYSNRSQQATATGEAVGRAPWEFLVKMGYRRVGSPTQLAVRWESPPALAVQLEVPVTETQIHL